MTKTIIITGGSQGIGLAVAKTFLERDYNVIATSRNITKSKELSALPRLVLIDGDIGKMETALAVTQIAIRKFGALDALVNNAGLFLTKRFTEYNSDDFKKLVSTNLEGFFYITQQVIKQMLQQKSGGSIVSVTAALADNPIYGVNASLSMLTKGGVDAITKSIAIEYAKDKIRFNAVAPGVVDTPMHEKDSKEYFRTLSPMGSIANVQEIVDAIVYLAEAQHVTGEVLHVDGGSHIGRW